jgi:hypothetical protein
VPPASARRRVERDTPETEALRLAVHQPDVMLDLLGPALFDDDVRLAAFRALGAAGGDVHQAIVQADPAAADLLQRLAVEDSEADPTDVRRRLLAEKATRIIHELEASARRADDPTAYGSVMGWLKLQIEKVQPDAPADRASEDDLLAWLTQQVEEFA